MEGAGREGSNARHWACVNRAPLHGLNEHRLHRLHRMNLGDSLRKMRYGARYLFTRKR